MTDVTSESMLLLQPTTTTKHSLFFNTLPPSANTYYRNFHGHMVLSAKGREFKLEMQELCVGKTKIDGLVCVTLNVWFKDKRRRDLDNYFKAVLDAFKNILFEDDCMVAEIHASKVIDCKNQPQPHQEGFEIIVERKN